MESTEKIPSGTWQVSILNTPLSSPLPRQYEYDKQAFPKRQCTQALTTFNFYSIDNLQFLYHMEKMAFYCPQGSGTLRQQL